MTGTAGGAPTVMLLCDYSLRYLGGAQTAFLRQARSLVGQGWTVIVVAPDADAVPACDGLVRVAPPVLCTLPGLELPVLRSRRSARAHVDALAVKYSVEGMIVHSEFTLAAAALSVGAERGIPVLHTVHTFFWRAPRGLSPLAPGVRAFHRWFTGIPCDVRYSGSTPINNALRGMTLRVALRADVVLSPSEHQAQALRNAGVTQARALSNVSEPLQATPPPGGSALTLLWAARFAPEKRLEVALEAMRRVTAKLGPGAVHLHVAGGAGRPQPDVEFHGRMPSGEVGALIARSDAVLITSLGFDNQPMVALEAFTRGRPVVVTDPVLQHEFGAAAVGCRTPDAAGLADVLVGAAADRTVFVQAGERAREYAAARQPAQHAVALRAALQVATGARRHA